MRDRKNLLLLNVKVLTNDEIEDLGTHGLNCCDKCGDIELSVCLHWIDSEEFWDDEACIKMVTDGICALCDLCYEKRNE